MSTTCEHMWVLQPHMTIFRSGKPQRFQCATCRGYGYSNPPKQDHVIPYMDGDKIMLFPKKEWSHGLTVAHNNPIYRSRSRAIIVRKAKNTRRIDG